MSLGVVERLVNIGTSFLNKVKMSSNRKRQWWERVSDRLRPLKQPRVIQQQQDGVQGGSRAESASLPASDSEEGEDFDLENTNQNLQLPSNTPYEHKTVVLKDRNVTFYVIRTGFQRQR